MDSQHVQGGIAGVQCTSKVNGIGVLEPQETTRASHVERNAARWWVHSPLPRACIITMYPWYATARFPFALATSYEATLSNAMLKLSLLPVS